MYHLECRYVTDEKHSISQANRLASRERCSTLWRPHYRRIPHMEWTRRHTPPVPHGRCLQENLLPQGLYVRGEVTTNEKGKEKEKEKERRIRVDCVKGQIEKRDNYCKKRHTERVDEFLDAHQNANIRLPSQDHTLGRLQKSEAKQLALEAIRKADLRDVEEPHKIKDQKRKSRISQSQHGLSDVTKCRAPRI